MINSVTLIVIVSTIFICGYKFYGDKITAIWKINENRTTPAVYKFDGVDFVPAKNWLVLFGHHFSSIAGAGPIIGPVIAVCFWGWGPALLWVIFGSIFLGAIHDFGSLMISVREDGSTINEIAERAISRKAKIILSIFTWLALILVIAVFAYLGADTFVKQPKIVLPSLGIIPVSVIFGIGLYRFRLNPVLMTSLGLIALAILIFLGDKNPVTLSGGNALATWIIILFAYCFIASTIPVNILLQPRDYLSSFMLIGGIILAVLGIFISHPDLKTPAYISTPNSIGYLWPMMFITVACGANSGFHSLIASGTTSKQLASEAHAKKIGVGGMIVEGFLASIVIILIAGGFSLPEFQQHIADKTSPVRMYGIGFGNMTAPIVGQWGVFMALTILNAFILTTLDSATRITRYITEELFGIKNRYLSTGIITILGAWLALGKDSADNPLWQTIWPAFGASNQLVAALALLVITCWLLGKKRPTLYSLIPAGFMLVTSITALALQTRDYWDHRQYLLIAVSVILIVSALYLANEVLITFKKASKGEN